MTISQNIKSVRHKRFKECKDLKLTNISQTRELEKKRGITRRGYGANSVIKEPKPLQKGTVCVYDSINIKTNA